MIGAWLLRAAGGSSRRINAITPLRAVAYDPAEVIEAAAPLYAALQRPLVFRVPAIAEGLEAALARHGFDGEEEVCTLIRWLDGTSATIDTAIHLSEEPTPAWLALRSRLTGGDADTDRVTRAVIGSLLMPRIFVGVHGPEGLATIALGVLDRRLLVVEAVGTDSSARGRGHARQAMLALMDWARTRGARAACLQVVADNAPARQLYERLGFTTDLYRYRYFTRAAC